MFAWLKALNLKHYVFLAVVIAAVAFKFEAMPHQIVSALLRGATMSEAVYAFGQIPLGWLMSIRGDPLCTPYSGEFVSGFGFSDKDAT